MDLPDDDHLSRSVTELGDPDALFRVSPGRLLAKLAVGLLLVLGGLVANYLWWVHPRGPGTFGHVELFLLIVVPLSGAALLFHMYRERGLYVLLYPTGLLRLRRGEVDSLPWAEVDHVLVKVQRAAGADLDREPDGSPAGCWLPPEVPTFQLWNGGLTVVREDGVSVHLGPALTDFALLAEEVQRRTFAHLWPPVWARFQDGFPVMFGELEASRAGLRHGGKFLPWGEVKELTVAQGKLSVKQGGKWLPWVLVDVSAVPNPHVLFALAAEAQRGAHAPPAEPKHHDLG
ncbi:MAG: hypothetical protein C0501_15440 [Isosphaera sp.]|nr:hypothetical protein [Isosphaera sp.]